MGAIIGDHNGNWIVNDHRYLDNTTNIMAEFWPLKDGLVLAHRMHINNVIVELNPSSRI